VEVETTETMDKVDSKRIMDREIMDDHMRMVAVSKVAVDIITGLEQADSPIEITANAPRLVIPTVAHAFNKMLNY
jgi:hypothetical protein